MNYTLVALLSFFVGGLPAMAYDLTVTEIDKPYEIVSIETDIEELQIHLGELNNFPVMYEFVSESSSTIDVLLQQDPQGGSDVLPLGLMIVRVGERGSVSEVLRFNAPKEDWTKTKDSSLGVAMLSSGVVSRVVGPGTYRVEVSTPDNQGRYLLQFGEKNGSDGYFEALGHVRETQKFFGYSIFKMLTSSLVYYPIGILFLLFAIQKTWKYRKTITNVA